MGCNVLNTTVGYLGDHYLRDSISIRRDRVLMADMEAKNMAKIDLTREALPVIRFRTEGLTHVIL